MSFKKFWVIMSFICLFACSNSSAVSVTDETSGQKEAEYLKTDFPDEKLNLSSISLENCQSAVRLRKNLFLVQCRNSKKDSKKDYGLRLFLIEKIKVKPVIRFQSHGAGDCYYMRQSVFKNVKAEKPLIILAEAGAEFSYGVGVYLLSDMQMKYIGELDVTVNEDDTPSSAVPFIKITEKGDQLIFTFTKDVLILQDNGEYKVISKNRLRYRYSGGQIEKIKYR